VARTAVSGTSGPVTDGTGNERPNLHGRYADHLGYRRSRAELIEHLFDFLTVACFFSMVIAFFLLTKRDPKTLIQLFLSGLAFAVANQAGNAGWTIVALILVVAGAGYAAFVIRSGHNGAPR